MTENYLKIIKNKFMNRKIPKRFSYSLMGFLISSVILISLFILIPADPNDKTFSSIKIHTIFTSENEYIEYIKNNVEFRELELSIVEIKKGDNFWKIAKEHNVNIDTLIGANPYWSALTAKLKENIVVPSRIGVLHFITDFKEIDELISLYGVERKNLVIQKLPPFYRLYRNMFSIRKPVAVFIQNTKPAILTMTSGMAEKFALREMFKSPLGGRFSSFFGGRIHPIFHEYGFHNGVDIATMHGTAVGASCAGIVAETGWMGGYGKAVIINHENGYRTLYGHLSSIYVRPGQKIPSGRIIGRVGSTGWSTGPHLHFTLWHNGRLINPMNVLW